MLKELVQYCPHVTDFHLHFVHCTNIDDGMTVFMDVTKNFRNLGVFTTTCEAQSSPVTAITSQLLDYHIHGHLVYRTRQKHFNYAVIRKLRRTCLCPVKSLERVCLLSKTELQLRTRNVQWKLWQASYHPSCTCTSTVWTRKRAGTPA